MKKHRIYTTSFAGVYAHYVRKAETKGRKKQEVDEVICWLTGYSRKALAEQIDQRTDFETFFAEAPALNPNAGKITGVVCGVRIEEIDGDRCDRDQYGIRTGNPRYGVSCGAGACAPALVGARSAGDQVGEIPRQPFARRIDRS